MQDATAGKVPAPLIFISYRRDDGGHGRSLYEKLRDWFDADDVFLDHENLDPGAKFKPELDAAARGCQICLAVIGPHWLSDKNRERLQDPDDITRCEIRTALAAGKQVIPVLAGGANFPPIAALPADIAGLSEDNAHHQLEAQYRASFQKLLDTLERRHGLKPRYRRQDGRRQPFYLARQQLTPHFADPTGKLPALHDLLAQNERAALTATTVQGMGGVGKTQLALRYSHAFRDEYDGVWWFRAEENASLQEDALELCRDLEIERRDNEEPSRSVARWLKAQPRWLLVYDNVEDPKAVAAKLPEAGGHHVLFTSRNPTLDDLAAAALDIKTWTDEQALDFLRERLPTASDDERRALSHSLGGLPLALEQAAAYIRHNGIAIADYQTALDDITRRQRLLVRADSANCPRSVQATLSLAFDRLSEAARELLHLCAWLAPEPIPEFLFTEATQELPPALATVAADPLAWGETLGELTGYGLCQRDGNNKTLSFHRLTQAAAQNTPEAGNYVRQLQLVLLTTCPIAANLPENWGRFSTLFAHVIHVDRIATNGWMDMEEHALLLDRIGNYLRFGPSLYLESSYWLGRALEIEKSLLGEEHPNTLTSMSNLAITLLTAGDLAGARELQESELEIAKRVLGSEHQDTLTSMNNLASTLLDQGNLDEALNLHSEVLETRRRVLGEDHPDTLQSANNLAAALYEKGDLDSALDLIESALTKRIHALGKDHPDTLASLNNLASILHGRGELDIALKIKQGVLTNRRRILGETHPDTIASAWNLFTTAFLLGDHLLSIELMEIWLFPFLKSDPLSLNTELQTIRQQLLDNRTAIESFTGLTYPRSPP